MRDRLKSCEVFRDNRSIPSVSEKGKTYQIDNKEKEEIACIRVDNCVFKQTDGKKCDYLFEIEGRKKVIYVELKGSDIVRALKQVYETLKQTKHVYAGWVNEVRIVVGNRVPTSIYNRQEYENLRKSCSGGKVTIHHINIYKETL